ncbi:Abi family protein [Clostridium sp. OF09-36]|uniref:Abi family protein n=1 Tax=Clostridium sp. OF09-36 TaxID=2292310 RepID=UPI000E4D968A|nr:Abi family protein [Clostridium sp. OF09-36]RHV86265.1 Abi family protein [Clostridium sp. OF09-36]
MGDKPFKTHEELIVILTQRGIKIDSDEDKAYAKTVLAKEGYYNLINGYNKLFLDSSAGPDHYKDGTTLYEIHALYQFDRVLRDIFFRYILRVETHVKNLIAYYFPMKYGHSNYLLYNNFNTKVKDAQTNITSLISEIQRQIASRTSDPSISHYLKEYGYIPLWVLNNILTFGTISKFYSLMQVKERQDVSRTFGIMDNELENALMYLSAIRNFCAHGNRLYCYRTKKALIDTKLHDQMGIAKNSRDEYMQGKRDLFAALIALRRLLSHNDYKRMTEELSRSIRNLNKKLSVLSPDDVLKEMGFPTNWKDLGSLPN